MHVLNAYKETVLYVITLKDLFYLGKVVLGTNIFTCGCEKTSVSLKFTVLCLPIASDKILKKINLLRDLTIYQVMFSLVMIFSSRILEFFGVFKKVRMGNLLKRQKMLVN